MSGRPVLLFDGDCGYCRRWVAWSQSHGADVDFRPCQDATELRAIHGIPDEQCRQTAMYVDDHGVLTHEQAIYAVLRRLRDPGTRKYRIMGRIASIALFWPMGRLGYLWVAKNRHRLRGPKP